MATFERSCEIRLEESVECLTVCNDTCGFFGNPSGRVMPAESASVDSVALPQPCIFAKLHLINHLMVISADGAVRLQCHCDIDWNSAVWGLHCDRQLLYVAQSVALMVTDLSGRLKTRICTMRFGFIKGICGDAASVFVSSGNRVAAFSKATGQQETIIELAPDADLGGLAIHDGCIFAAEREQGRVLVVHIETKQLIASHPTQRAGLTGFAWPHDVVVDSRGRLFVTELEGHTVRSVSIGDGSLLWTLGLPGVLGEPDIVDEGLLWSPCGLALLLDGSSEQLLLSDGRNDRILMFNLK